MTEHHFTIDLHLSENDKDVDDVLERLGANGCTDATVGLGRPGMMRLIFDREAASAKEAVASAIKDLRHAVPGGKTLLVDGSMGADF